MKIKSFILAAFVALVVSTGSTTALFAQEKSKSLVVYFSRADENYGVGNITEGNTAILAKMIAQKTGSDIFEIVPEKAYPKSYNECTTVAKDEQRKKARPAYKGDIDTSGYDTIYIGYPPVFLLLCGCSVQCGRSLQELFSWPHSCRVF